jgi:hypothetical protein
MVIAFWALDHAARQGHRWVRRGVLTDDNGANRGLIRYYRKQGWRVVRSITHPHRADITVWSLARPTELQPHLPDICGIPHVATSPRLGVWPRDRRALPIVDNQPRMSGRNGRWVTDSR